MTNMKNTFLVFAVILVSLPLLAEVIPEITGPPRIVAELGLPELPDTMTFCRSDSALLQYGWSVRVRLYPDSSNVPDVLNLCVKYEHGPGEGCYSSTFVKECQWGLERLGTERIFYRLGNMRLALTDSSMLMEAEIPPYLFDSIDSIDVYAVTDRFLRDEGYSLRDMTDYKPIGKKFYDRVGDLNDPRFDIRFLRVDIENLPPKEPKESEE